MPYAPAAAYSSASTFNCADASLARAVTIVKVIHAKASSEEPVLNGRCNRTYDHVVADVAERGLLEDVLHEAVSRRVELQRVARLGARRGRRGARDGRRNRRDGEAGGVRRGHPDVAEMARAAAHIGEQLRLVVVAGSEEVVGALAADALGLEGQGAFESLQLTRERKR